MRTTESLDRGVAFGQYEYVDVTFGSANVDLRIRHQLKVTPLTEVYYIVVKKDRAADVYTGTLSLWDQQHITLKSDVADLEATILLFTRKL
jgi:hypothetical protein